MGATRAPSTHAADLELRVRWPGLRLRAERRPARVGWTGVYAGESRWRWDL